MPLGMAAGTAMGGMGMTITMVTTTVIRMTMHMTTIMGTATITATPAPPLQLPQPVGAPCPSPWSPKGMCTAPTATTTTEMAMGRPQRNPLTVRAEPVETRAYSTRHLAPHPQA